MPQRSPPARPDGRPRATPTDRGLALAVSPLGPGLTAMSFTFDAESQMAPAAPDRTARERR